MPAIILSSVNTNFILKKRSCKQGAIISAGSTHIKMIFALLTEQVAISMQFTKIQVEELSLKELLVWLC